MTAFFPILQGRMRESKFQISLALDRFEEAPEPLPADSMLAGRGLERVENL